MSAQDEQAYGVINGYLVAYSSECTCSPHYGAHEPHCGNEPIALVSELLAERDRIRTEARREALEEAARAVEDCSGVEWALSGQHAGVVAGDIIRALIGGDDA